MGARQFAVTPQEKVLAILLKNAGIDFVYEPHEFRLYFGGEQVKAFRPDFYLPDAKLYLEVGNKKHKRHKLKRMRHSYPNVRVVVLDNDAVLRYALDVENFTKGSTTDEILDWIQETWIDQEYILSEYAEQRCEARDLARQYSKKISPSERVY